MNINNDKGESLWENLGLDSKFMDELDDKFNEAVFKAMQVETRPKVTSNLVTLNKHIKKEKQKQDNFAIEFLKWCESKSVFSPSVIHKPTYEKLLIQFKKEKGL